MSKKKNSTMASEKKIKWIDIDKIIPNYEQSRKVNEEDTRRLAKSIEKIGLIRSHHRDSQKKEIHAM